MRNQNTLQTKIADFIVCDVV